MVALANSMRLSLRKGVHPGFPVKFIGVDALHAAFLNESRARGRLARISCHAAPEKPRVRLSLKERRMRSADAIKFHRKSG
jgi:hypothetical protein